MASDSGDRFRKAFLIVMVVSISVVFLGMIRGFIMTVLLGAIFSGLAYPLYERLVKLFRQHRSAASLVTLLLVLIMVFGPLLAFLGVVASEAVRITVKVGPWVQQQIEDPDRLTEVMKRLPGFDTLEPYRAEILTRVGQFVGFLGNFLVDGLSHTTKGTVAFFFHFFLMLYSMFFFLLDGPAILKKILYYLPLAHDDEMRVVGRFVSVTRATIKGTLVIGVLQGGLAGGALAIAGIPSAVFWGTMMVVLSIIPGIGTALVWIPAAIYLLATGHILKGVLLIAFCGVIVGSIDNILRPALVGKDTQMHDLLILFGTLGGIIMFGVAGFIIGPIIAALFVTIWDIYGVIFKDELPEVGSLSRDG